MKSVEWKVVLTDSNEVVSVESTTNLLQENVESHLLMIGILENLKKVHLDKLNVFFNDTRKNDSKAK